MFTWIFMGLAIWAIYRRIRRLIGRQLFRQGWVIFRFVFLFIGTTLLILPRVLSIENLVFIFLGVGIGIGLFWISIRYTTFQMEGIQLYYKTSPYFGSIILLLVLIRFLYKIPVILYLTNLLSHIGERQPDLTVIRSVLDPFSIVLIMMMISYFLGFNLYVLWAARSLKNKVKDSQMNGFKSYASDSSSPE